MLVKSLTPCLCCHLFVFWVGGNCSLLTFNFYLYCRWTSSYQERVVIPLTSFPTTLLYMSLGRTRISSIRYRCLYMQLHLYNINIQTEHIEKHIFNPAIYVPFKYLYNIEIIAGLNMCFSMCSVCILMLYKCSCIYFMLSYVPDCRWEHLIN
jgi:hypothetical protein